MRGTHCISVGDATVIRSDVRFAHLMKSLQRNLVRKMYRLTTVAIHTKALFHQKLVWCHNQYVAGTGASQPIRQKDLQIEPLDSSNTGNDAPRLFSLTQSGRNLRHNFLSSMSSEERVTFEKNANVSHDFLNYFGSWKRFCHVLTGRRPEGNQKEKHNNT